MAEADKIITATLVRGKTYSYYDKGANRYLAFKRAVPVEVSEENADVLEELVEIITTTDGDEVEKPVFSIDRDAEARSEEDAPKRVRLRVVAVESKTKNVASRSASVPGRTGGLRTGPRK